MPPKTLADSPYAAKDGLAAASVATPCIVYPSRLVSRSSHLSLARHHPHSFIPRSPGARARSIDDEDFKRAPSTRDTDRTRAPPSTTRIKFPRIPYHPLARPPPSRTRPARGRSSPARVDPRSPRLASVCARRIRRYKTTRTATRLIASRRVASLCSLDARTATLARLALRARGATTDGATTDDARTLDIIIERRRRGGK